MSSPLSSVGALLADETRSSILCVLMDGRAHTGGELARFLGIAPSTASGHLSRLADAGLVSMRAQGRHRYFQLANADIAAALEQVGAMPVDSLPDVRAPSALRYARTCYNHLAGALAVRIYEQLLVNGHINLDGDKLDLTRSGTALWSNLGADVPDSNRRGRALVRPCLDWTERRSHLAGSAATSLLEAMLDRRWLARDSIARSLRVTERGKTELFAHFDLSLST